MPEVSVINKENIESVMHETNIQGVSIAYQPPEGPLEETTIGKTDGSHTTPKENVEKDTMFGAASLSKPIFAYLVLKLIEKGLLRENSESCESALDRPLSEIISLEAFVNTHGKSLNTEDRERSLKITPRMLLSHSSGLGMSDVDKLEFEPGTQYAYSGFGLMYLQQAIEQLTNKPLEVLADEEVFKPLGMNRSTFLLQEPEPTASSQIPKKAHAHNSVHTTAKDYTAFTRSWMKDPSPFMQKAFEPQIMLTNDQQKVQFPRHSESSAKDVPEYNKAHLAWGLGFGLELDDAGKAIKAFHTGDMSEIRAQVALDLKTQSSVVFFSLGLNHAESNGHVLGPLVITPKIPIPHAYSWFYTKFPFAKSPEELIGGANSGARKPELKATHYRREDADKKDNKAIPQMVADQVEQKEKSHQTPFRITPKGPGEI